jgi:2-polyprenyl-6-methoxyphenol hydroxylase-like FAD-dependent oxidoreductase
MSPKDEQMRAIVGRQAIVIGAGIAGLTAARALADTFEQVIVLERDELPDSPTSRTGVPQGKQPHALLARGLEGLLELFPGFNHDLDDAGAVYFNAGVDALFEYADRSPFPKRDLGISVYSATRPLTELAIRRRVKQFSNISLRAGHRVLGLIGEPDGSTVTGVRYTCASGKAETLPADLVVDASAHAAPTLSFLEATGRSLPEKTIIGSDIRYSSTFVDVSQMNLKDYIAVATYAKAPDSVRFGYLIPVENGLCQLLLIGRGNDVPPMEANALKAYAKHLATLTIYNAIKDAEFAGAIHRYGAPESVWSHFDRLDDFPRRLLPIGDAICRFSPIYGQGMTVAIREAVLLRRLLEDQATQAGSLSFPAMLDTLGKTFQASASAVIKAPWEIAALTDFIYPQTTGERPPDLEQALEFQAGLLLLAIRDPAVHKLMFEVQHLIKPPALLNDPDLVRRVEEEMTATPSN